MEFEPIIAKVRPLLPKRVAKNLPRDIGVISISSPKSREINNAYRGKDCPTNILSFWYSPDYGELLVCLPVIRKEARASGRSFEFQMTWMIVHGMLHLGGMHHEESERRAETSEVLENNILQKIFKSSGD